MRNPDLAAFARPGIGEKANTIKVPYAKKWQKETDKLRSIAIDCDLTETLKWGASPASPSRRRTSPS